MLKFAILLTALAVCYGQQTEYTLFYEDKQTGLPDTGTLEATHEFNAELDTIILIHGHLGGPADPFNLRIRNEILIHRKEVQIIVVGWERAASADYEGAFTSVVIVAGELNTFISGLITGTTVTVNVRKLHLVGFGLGAHVAGQASRGLGVGRITGLDPDGRGWETFTSGRLTQSDANYVEVIHTDGSGLLANGIGTAIGQVNFYVNGGSNQPGCLSHSCSHNRAYELFAASLSNSNLVGYPCSTKTQMYLNRCRGNHLLVGDTEIEKTTGLLVSVVPIYRINTGRSWPF